MSQSFDLARAAPQDFTGPQAVHGPAVAGGLVATAEALGAAIADIPGLLSESARLAQALAAAAAEVTPPAPPKLKTPPVKR
jgi:hypothetical protein